MAPNDKNTNLVTIGEVTGVHGIRGNLKIHSFAESLSLFMLEEGVQLQLRQGRLQRATITGVKPHGRRLLATLEGVGDRNQAEALVGTLICIERRHLPEPEVGTYYWTDLIGCEVYTLESRYLGRVHSIIATGGHDVLVVRDGAEKAIQETLVPAVADLFREVDLSGKRLTVELPEGL